MYYPGLDRESYEEEYEKAKLKALMTVQLHPPTAEDYRKYDGNRLLPSALPKERPLFQSPSEAAWQDAWEECWFPFG